MNAYSHLSRPQSLIGYAKFKGVPSPTLAVIGSGLLMLLGGLSLVSGMFMFWGDIALLIFMIPVTFTMHAFWKESDPQAKMNERIQFFKNLAIIGALLMMF